jgi:predicted alpha/beta-fold hydrolase
MSALLPDPATTLLPPSAFSPSPWFTNAHVQSIVSSLRIRRPWLNRRARQLLAASQDRIIDCGDGVRLLGHYSSQEALGRPAAQEIVVLLHGWEGSADSMYVLSLGSYLFDRGCDIFRLNFRDHGSSHHLNEDIFHSCRLDEVVGAVRAIQRTLPTRRMSIAGFSLGGNFALRVAAAAHDADIQLQHAFAVCPVLRPHSTMDALEHGSFIYHRYFLAKWKQSLRLKQSLFPKRFDFSAILAQTSIKSMTRLMVEQYSEFETLDAYLDGYAITGDALAALEVPSHILFALDDPIIPASDLGLLAKTSALTVNAMTRGGHCGFMERLNGESWADREIARLLGLAS